MKWHSRSFKITENHMAWRCHKRSTVTLAVQISVSEIQQCTGQHSQAFSYCTQRVLQGPHQGNIVKITKHSSKLLIQRKLQWLGQTHRQTDILRQQTSKMKIMTNVFWQELLMFANVMACYTDLANDPQVHRAPSVSRPVHQTTQEVSRYNSHYYNHRQLSHQWSTNDISMTTGITFTSMCTDWLPLYTSIQWLNTETHQQLSCSFST